MHGIRGNQYQAELWLQTERRRLLQGLAIAAIMYSMNLV